MNAIKAHIENREKEIEELKLLQLQLESINDQSNFTPATWREIQARISSKFAQLEISIRSHRKLLPLEQSRKENLPL